MSMSLIWTGLEFCRVAAAAGAICTGSPPNAPAAYHMITGTLPLCADFVSEHLPPLKPQMQMHVMIEEIDPDKRVVSRDLGTLVLHCKNLGWWAPKPPHCCLDSITMTDALSVEATEIEGR